MLGLYSERGVFLVGIHRSPFLPEFTADGQRTMHEPFRKRTPRSVLKELSAVPAVEGTEVVDLHLASAHPATLDRPSPIHIPQPRDAAL